MVNKFYQTFSACKSTFKPSGYPFFRENDDAFKKDIETPHYP